MDDEYTLELTAPQLEVLKIALEEWFRIRLNQWYWLADDLAMARVNLTEASQKHNEDFERYIARKECIQAALEAVGQMAFGNRCCRKSEEQMIAEDIWQVIRYELWKENHGPDGDWCVDSRPPLRQSKEPLPVIRKAAGKRSE